MNWSLDHSKRLVGIFVCILLAILFSALTVNVGTIVPLGAMLIGGAIIFIIMVFKDPFVGVITTTGYGFLHILIGRLLGVDFNFGYLVEFLYILLWVVLLFKTRKDDWKLLLNDLTLLFTIWFLISVLELLNPAGASPRGWLHEIRSSGLDSFLLVPIGFLVFRKISHLDIFLYGIIMFSILAAINGITQTHLGLTNLEHRFLESNPTHMIWGKLRAFSFYRDAGQFGASQAHLALITGILSIGPFKLWKRIVLMTLTLLFLYGMLISGTRGSFFVIVPGAFLAIFLFKNVRVLVFGILLLFAFLAVLKYTHLGSGNYHIHRFRSALNPEDASLNVRFSSQQALREYLDEHPFGGGLGVIGYAGTQYNSDKFLSTIAPDSYWVKVWAMYGIVGFVLWFCMIMFILGKCCGIVWNIQDHKLRVKLIALTAGFCGIFVSSYGNEVLNGLPSSIVVYLSLVLIYLGPKFDALLLSDSRPLIPSYSRL